MQESLWDSSRAEQNPRAPDAWKVFPRQSEHILRKDALTHGPETQRFKPWVDPQVVYVELGDPFCG